MTDRVTITSTCKDCGEEFAQELPNNAFAMKLRWHQCPDCRLKARAEFQAADEELRRRGLMQDKLEFVKASGIPEAYHHVTLEGFDVAWDRKRLEPVVERLQDWVDSFYTRPLSEAPSIVLYSEGYGAGKTHLACAVLQGVVSRITERTYNPILFTTAAQALGFLAAARRDKGGEEVVYQKLLGVKLLALDDIGKERPRPESEEFYYRVIDGRCSLGRPLILTSNAMPGDLANIIGGAAVSRIQVMAAGWMMNLTGPDYRAEQARRKL